MALCREWQDFLGRRIAEGFALVQRLGTARSPEQVRAAYVAFWQKAANDYSQECGSPVKLAGVLTNPSITNMQGGKLKEEFCHLRRPPDRHDMHERRSFPPSLPGPASLDPRNASASEE